VPSEQRGGPRERPVDPDVDLQVEAERRSAYRSQAPVLGVIAAGGAIGAAARHLATTQSGGFPWSTFWVNVSGCLLIGVLIVLVTEVWTAHRLVRPFLGTGVLGGYTTFSAYSVETIGLIAEGRAGIAAAYAVGTLAAALAAVVVGMRAGRALGAVRAGRTAR
jgi:CrcB protein